MKNALPKEQANEYFIGLKTQARNINAREFTKYEELFVAELQKFKAYLNNN